MHFNQSFPISPSQLRMTTASHLPLSQECEIHVHVQFGATVCDSNLK